MLTSDPSPRSKRSISSRVMSISTWIATSSGSWSNLSLLSTHRKFFKYRNATWLSNASKPARMKMRSRWSVNPSRSPCEVGPA